MTFKTHLDEAAFRKEISRWVKHGKTPDYPDCRPLCKEELIGGINDDRFWLKKIQPRLSNAPQRVFYGKITKESECVIVRGRFRHLPTIRHTGWVLVLVFLLLYVVLNCYQEINIVDFSKGLLITLLCSVFLIELLNLATILFFLGDEIFVIKYLKSL